MKMEDLLNPCETLGRGSFGTRFGLTFARMWLGTQGKAEFGQHQGTFGIHLERGPGGDLLASFGGRREAESTSFSPGSMNQLAWRVKGCTSESFLELLQRGWRTGGESWLARHREGQAHEGPGAWGGGGQSPRRRPELSQSALPPGGAPSCGSEVVLPALWAGRRSSPLTNPPQHYTRGLGATSHPVSPSGAGTPPDVSPSLQDICFLTLSATPQKSPILLHPGPQLAQDKTFVPSGHPRNPFSGCDPTTPFPCI